MFEKKERSSKNGNMDSNNSKNNKSGVGQRLTFTDNRVQFSSKVVQRVDYKNKPWCTSKLVSKTGTFDKRYYRKVESHTEETNFLKAAVDAANAITGHSSKDDYTETRGHVAAKPNNASLI